jgi:hypothetical protein
MSFKEYIETKHNPGNTAQNDQNILRTERESVQEGSGGANEYGA